MKIQIDKCVIFLSVLFIPGCLLDLDTTNDNSVDAPISNTTATSDLWGDFDSVTQKWRKDFLASTSSLFLYTGLHYVVFYYLLSISVFDPLFKQDSSLIKMQFQVRIGYKYSLSLVSYSSIHLSPVFCSHCIVMTFSSSSSSSSSSITLLQWNISHWCIRTREIFQ